MIMLRKAICHVRYINILTWLRGFQDKLLSQFAVVFFVSKSLSGIQRQIGNFIDPKASEHVRILIIHRTWPI